MRRNLTPFVLVGVSLLLLGIAFVAAFFLPFWDYSSTQAAIIPTRPPPAPPEKAGALPEAVNAAGGNGSGGPLKYNPPKLEDAPEEIRASIQRGYNILMDPQKEVPEHVGNDMKCRNCHFNAGLSEGGKNGGLTLVGTAATYPKYRARQEYSVDLTVRVNDCFERSENGKALAPGSRDMTDILTYFKWISKGIPIYGDVPWLGLQRIESTHKPDANAGKEVYTAKCVACHGADGAGTPAGPPLWGDRAYNDGAGMARPETLAGFALLNMPYKNPDLTPEQALDVGVYVDSQPRPKFVKPTPTTGG
jgi:thiosulfate dehydrogenase